MKKTVIMLWVLIAVFALFSSVTFAAECYEKDSKGVVYRCTEDRHPLSTEEQAAVQKPGEEIKIFSKERFVREGFWYFKKVKQFGNLVVFDGEKLIPINKEGIVTGEKDIYPILFMVILLSLLLLLNIFFYLSKKNKKVYAILVSSLFDLGSTVCIVFSIFIVACITRFWIGDEIVAALTIIFFVVLLVFDLIRGLDSLPNLPINKVASVVLAAIILWVIIFG